MFAVRPGRRTLLVSGLVLAIAFVAVVGFAVAGVARAGVFAPDQQPQPAPPARQGHEFLIQVDSVDVQIRESFPVQVAALVEGVLGNGCTRFERVEQTRTENTIFVRIVGYHSGAERCTMIAHLYRDTIRIEGPLPPGSYTLDVNGVIREFRVD
jgi:hypothetical protein